MELHLKITGILLVLLALMHVAFPKYFRWKTELSQVSDINRQMMYVHAFFIAFTVLLMGILCLTSAGELLASDLGRKLSLGIGIFWLVRLYMQFFGYSAILWKGKAFETSMHVVFSILWTYFSGVFLLIYFL
jgi:hypothetical protein